MKNYSIFLALVLALVSLSACETQGTHSKQKTGASAPLKQDFLTTGRALSKGAVDLYQPGTDFLPTEQFPSSGRAAVSAIPGNSNILVNDPNVTIYSLDTAPEAPEPQPAPLPPLQPPSKVIGEYPSPFDGNGNPTR